MEKMAGLRPDPERERQMATADTIGGARMPGPLGGDPAWSH
jgi:hypothetical protein